MSTLTPARGPVSPQAMRTELGKLNQEIQDVNWKRKSDQEKAGATIRELEIQWGGLVSKNYEIERACRGLENEIAYLKRQAAAAGLAP